jgi:murein DD-endopeptidase MepM/ murein hydrolase activator NlpD
MRTECGAGHCGIDLDGPRGRPLVAVADGIVVRVELHELGLDGRSGRYVRIEHDDGTLTSYMHLDDVAPLQPGDRILAGQYLGTLGASGVYDAVAHLHFSLEVPNHPGHGPHGDTTDTHYVDPAPYLVRATIVDVADRRRGRRPAL